MSANANTAWVLMKNDLLFGHAFQKEAHLHQPLSRSAALLCSFLFFLIYIVNFRSKNTFINITAPGRRHFSTLLPPIAVPSSSEHTDMFVPAPTTGRTTASRVRELEWNQREGRKSEEPTTKRSTEGPSVSGVKTRSWSGMSHSYAVESATVEAAPRPRFLRRKRERPHGF